MKIATSRFANGAAIKASGLAPVAITLGLPRGRLGYQFARVLSLAPHGLFKITDRGEFTLLYRELLDYSGRPNIEHLLGAAWLDYRVATKTTPEECPGVVLLCYEDVHAGDWCHRQVFAEWWKDTTKQRVVELAA